MALWATWGGNKSHRCVQKCVSSNILEFGAWKRSCSNLIVEPSIIVSVAKETFHMPVATQTLVLVLRASRIQFCHATGPTFGSSFETLPRFLKSSFSLTCLIARISYVCVMAEAFMSFGLSDRPWWMTSSTDRNVVGDTWSTESNLYRIVYASIQY